MEGDPFERNLLMEGAPLESRSLEEGKPLEFGEELSKEEDRL